MDIRACMTVAGLGLLGIASAPALSAEAAGVGQAAPTADTEGQIQEVVITARRVEESLQDVPEAVEAVSSAEVTKLNLLQLQDLNKVIAGVNINNETGQISTRGVVLQVAAATPQPTTATYLNDAPVLSSELIQAMFDVGQIEFERGPQGTLRGISTPSGALALTTRRPDLENFSGYAQVSVTDLNAHNLQGATNLPLIAEKLAVRLAALQDVNEGTGVRSINNFARPETRTTGGRISVRFEPIDTLTANVMYQHLDDSSLSFGAGGVGGVFDALYTPNPSAPTGYNGPVISPYARKSVAAYPAVSATHVDDLTGEFGWSILGQKLTYVGSLQRHAQRPGESIGDQMNLLRGYPLNSSIFPVNEHINTHEFRVSSEEPILKIFSYTVGAFHEVDSVDTHGNNGAASFLPGAFGAPGTPPAIGAPNNRYVLDTLINTPRKIDETSAFADVIAHLTDKLELEGGARYIHSELNSSLNISTTPAYAAAAIPAPFCAGAGGIYGATYANVCDVPVPAQTIIVPGGGQHVTSKPWIYKGSISYHFTPDLMAYVSTGSSFRQGTPGIGLSLAPSTEAQLLPYYNHANETSRSYEGGVKWQFWDHRARVNVDYFHQIYDNYLYGVPGTIYYLNAVPAQPVVAANPFYASVPAKVDGVDLDFAVNVTRNWNVAGNFSWDDGRIPKTAIPCNSSKFNGVPDNGVPTVAGFQAAGVAVATCSLSPASSTLPKWNANLQSEYFMAATDAMDAFIRGNLLYNPSNPNISLSYTAPSYVLLDLFLGVRSPDGKWEVAAFGKNITNTVKILNESSSLTAPANFLQVFPATTFTQYAGVSLTPPREFGLVLRYAFGGG